MSSGRAVKGLGEIALRVNDLEKMQEFYENAVGLEVMKRFPAAVFFRVADGAGGHPQAFALFDRSRERSGPAIHGTTPDGVGQERSTNRRRLPDIRAQLGDLDHRVALLAAEGGGELPHVGQRSDGAELPG